MATIGNRQLQPLVLLGIAPLLALLLYPPESTYAPSNPHLIQAGRDILNAMKANEGRRWLTGQMEVHWEEARKDEMSNSVFERTGRYPAIRGWDTPFGSPERDAAWMIDTIIDDWRTSRIIPTISEHLGAPTYGGGFDNIFHRVSIQSCLTPGTRENRAVMAMLEAMAADLQALEDAGVPVLWRPWHEAGGGFWWSADGPERYKKLWSFTWTYLTKTKQLNNLIWVWSTLGRDNKDYAPYYPGDGTVDIVGGSMYNDGRTPAGNWPGLQAIAPSKLKAITEAGETMWPYDSDFPYVFFLVWTTTKDSGALPSIYRAPSAVTRSDVAAFIDGHRLHRADREALMARSAAVPSRPVSTLSWRRRVTR